MIKRLFFILALVASAAASPAAAEKISLNAISQYLNGFQTAQGDFTQVNGDGTISTGRIYINRPGRVRFEYNAPDESLVIAGGGQVAIFDAKSNAGPTQYPLNQTPLNLILKRNVNLAQARMVVAHDTDGKTTSVVAQDPDHPDYGTIRLVFTPDPTELRQWIITDGGGVQTTVILGELQKGMRLGAGLFDIRREIDNRK
ncbi:LolA family protein [Tropicimonas marinistellae]|uniref:LolA family protein n=1 Tax=Tropicimonas marinistellae TaxID=1739787 RepID=UPI0008314025|nr:outer membrane lipoprotein carrier protein LolA [Tropicimonas marinistellae]